jgi:hypothetical protein
MAADLVTRLKRLATAAGILAVFFLILFISAWNLVFHYADPGEMLVIISKSGDELPQDQLLANPGQKGPLADVLSEGRHFVWPVLYEVKNFQLKELNMDIPPGRIGVVTAKVGKPLAVGRILAGEGERGIRRRVLPPGRHRLNPIGYEVEIADATVITPGHVGFVTQLVGKKPKARFAGPGEKGIVQEVLQPGLYYLNPYEYNVREVEVGLNQISFLGEEQISFPSKDAFDIRLDATVEWELEPAHVAEVIDEFGAREEVEQKVLIAQSRSIGRLEGSKYGAKDFLLGEGRQKIQDAFTDKLIQKCREKHLEVHSAYIRHIRIPENLLVPIRQSFVAKEKETTAKVQEDTRKSAAKLEREQRLVEQRRQEVHAGTKALVEKINAEASRQVAEIEAETRRLVAEKQREIAKIEAERTELLGKARALVTQMLGEARAGLFALKVKAFGGDSHAFARYAFAQALQEDLQIWLVQTGEGTFWTDLGTSTSGGKIFGRLLEDSQKERAAKKKAGRR